MYVMQVEALERQLAPLAAALLAGGNSDASELLPEARARFDAALVEEPSEREMSNQERLRRLGVA